MTGRAAHTIHLHHAYVPLHTSSVADVTSTSVYTVPTVWLFTVLTLQPVLPGAQSCLLDPAVPFHSAALDLKRLLQQQGGPRPSAGPPLPPQASPPAAAETPSSYLSLPLVLSCPPLLPLPLAFPLHWTLHWKWTHT